MGLRDIAGEKKTAAKKVGVGTSDMNIVVGANRAVERSCSSLIYIS